MAPDKHYHSFARSTTSTHQHLRFHDNMDSPYEKHLETNYVPSVDEAIQIQEIIEASAKEISELDVQVTILQKQLDVLQEKRANIHAFSERHRALLSPMRKLTRDILEEIFLACLPADRNPCMSAVEAPMLLTRICSLWRQIAHSTPRIWARIHISLPVITLGEFSGEHDALIHETLVRRILKLREEAVAEWLGRSYACPLSISIFQGSSWAIPELFDRHNTIREELQQLYLSLIRNSIIPHHKRWRDLDICVVGNTLHRFLDLGLNNESLQMLESLHVTHHGPLQMDSTSTPRYHWKDIVSLLTSRTTSATFHFFPIRSSDMVSISQQSWGNLMELNLKLACEQSSSVDGIQFASSILRQCHSLMILKFDSLAFHNNSSSHTDSIPLRHLTTLSIAQPINPGAFTFAKTLYLPSLKYLDIDLPFDLHQAFPGDGQETVAAEDIIKSILRTSEDFHTLQLHAPHWVKSIDDLVQLLKCIPDIRSLKVTTKHIKHQRWSNARDMGSQNAYRHVVNDDLLQAFISTGKSVSEIICPRLEEFECDHNLITDITEACLKEFVVSRQSDERVSSLRRISVFINQPKENDISNAEKVSMGMDSAIYFRRPLPVSANSPFDGFKNNFENWRRHGTEALVSDCYNCI